MIFFLCSGSYTLCKKKSDMDQPIRRNRTNIFTTSHLVNSHLYSNPAYRSELSSTNSFNNPEYSCSQYYTNNSNTFRSTTNIVEPSISFINSPPPSYWQIMNQDNPVNTNNSIRPPPPSYLNVSNLNKQNSK